MKRKLQIIKWIVISIFIVGIVALAVLLTMYGSNHAQIENKINEFRCTVDKIENKPTEDNENTDTQKSYDRTTDGDSMFLGNASSGIKNRVDVESLKKDSISYNEELKQNQNLKLVGNNYIYAALDLTNYGIHDNIYGYVSAPSIDMDLPIYLGANDDTMSGGAGHLCYTSLPTGGADTNVVLAGHTGYIGRWLFDSVSSLSVGDEVSVTTYFGKLDYKVTRVLNRAPNDSDILFIEKGKDKLTLITCIDGGSARRVVVCER